MKPSAKSRDPAPIQTHVPAAATDDEVMEAFYADLTKMAKKTRKRRTWGR